jgi:hypothetical protein
VLINPQENNEVSNANLTNKNTDWTIKSVDTIQPGKQSSSKSLVTAKNNVRKTKNQSAQSQVSGKAKATDVQTDQLIINDKTIETKDMLIDENGIRMKIPSRRAPHTQVQPPFPPVIFKSLSPAQLQQLKQLKQEKHPITIKKFPSPKPTP